MNSVAKAKFPVVQAVRVRLALALARAARVRRRHLVSCWTLVWLRVEHGRRGRALRHRRLAVKTLTIGAPARTDADDGAGPRDRGRRRRH